MENEISELATTPWLTAKETGVIMRVSQETLAAWRAGNKGPPWYQLNGPNGPVRYRRDEIDAWMNGQRATV